MGHFSDLAQSPTCVVNAISPTPVLGVSSAEIRRIWRRLRRFSADADLPVRKPQRSDRKCQCVNNDSIHKPSKKGSGFLKALFLWAPAESLLRIGFGVEAVKEPMPRFPHFTETGTAITTINQIQQSGHDQTPWLDRR